MKLVIISKDHCKEETYCECHCVKPKPKTLQEKIIQCYPKSLSGRKVQTICGVCPKCICQMVRLTHYEHRNTKSNDFSNRQQSLRNACIKHLNLMTCLMQQGGSSSHEKRQGKRGIYKSDIHSHLTFSPKSTNEEQIILNHQRTKKKCG